MASLAKDTDEVETQSGFKVLEIKIYTGMKDPFI